MKLQILRNSTLLALPEIDEQTIYSGEFMGMDKITAVFITPAPLKLAINDYVVYNNKQYKIKHATGCIEINSSSYKHNAVFYGEIYDLYDVPLSHLGRTKFSYTGTPLDLLGLIVDCLNEWFGGGWSIGDVSLIAEPETFTFDEVSCRVALSTAAEIFKLEYKVENKAMYLVEKVGILQPVKLKYGRGQGLQMISREAVDQLYATVWRFYGGNKNIPKDYRNGMDRITVDSIYEINTDLYSRKGGSVTFEDVFPQRTSGVEYNPDMNSIVDSTIDFNISDLFITENSAKIVFKTGELGGEEFVITGYNHNTKTIRFGTNKDDDTGYELPNENRKAAIGDKYTLIGIEMPQEYLSESEDEVERRGKEHAAKHSHPPVAFPLLIDEKYIREMGLINTFKPGDSFHVVSESLGVNSPLRLQSVSFPLVNPSNVTGVISDVLQYTQQERIVKDVKQNKKLTNVAQKTALYARQVADEISNAAIMHQFKKTYVGDRAVLSGAFVAGNPEAGEVAGMNGTGNDLDEVRFWAGSSYENRDEAPYKVNQKGELWATKAIIEGIIKALSGQIGNWIISNGGLVNDNGSAYIIARDSLPNGKEASVMIGPNIIPATAGGTRALGLFKNTEDNVSLGLTNYGLLIDVANGYKNIGIKSNAPIINEGFGGSFSRYQFTPTSNDNVINPRYGNMVSCFIESAAFYEVYFPVDEYITSMLGIDQNKDYCIQMIITNQFNSASDMRLRPAMGWVIKGRVSNAPVDISYLTVARSESVIVVIQKAGGIKWIQRINQ